MVVAWELEPGVDYLSRDDRGNYNIWWAGCYQSDKFLPLEKLIAPAFLSKYAAIAETAPTHRECGDGCVEIGGYGEPFTMGFFVFEPIAQ